MKTATINARIEPKLKMEVEEILKHLGITTTQLITMLYKQISNTQGIPFELRLPNEETIKILEESRRGINIEKITLDELIQEARTRVIK